MLDLVFIVCLSAAPMECRKERMAWEGSLASCAVQGQLVAVKWLSTHPKWRLTRWRCGPAELGI